MEAAAKKITVMEYVPAFVYGGIESTVRNVCRYAQENDERFRFVLVVEKQEAEVDFSDFDALGIKVIRLDKFKFSDEADYCAELEKIIKDEGVDIVHAATLTRASFVFKAAKKAGVKVRVFHAHTSNFANSFKNKIVSELLLRVARRRATDFLACSDVAAMKFFGERKSLIIYNGINVERFKYDAESRAKIRAQLGVGDDVFLLGHIGRFCEVKNHSFLIDCFASLVEKSGDTMLVLAGDGATKPEIESKVKALGLSDKVVFTGRINNPEKYFNAFDLFVLPSFYEGFPTVITEAQTSGLRSLVSDSVTRTCNITGLVSFLPLDVGAEGWANAVLEEKAKPFERKDMSGEMLRLGYDTDTNAEILLNHFADLYSRV